MNLKPSAEGEGWATVRDKPREPRQLNVWWSVAAWLIWGAFGVLLGNACIRHALEVVPTGHGFEFHEVGWSWMRNGTVFFASTLMVAGLSNSHRLYWWLFSLALSIVVWGTVSNRLDEIQFVRTPPCWGIHSMDPGSGASCPDGMREDFSVEQLRAYYDQFR